MLSRIHATSKGSDYLSAAAVGDAAGQRCLSTTSLYQLSVGVDGTQIRLLYTLTDLTYLSSEAVCGPMIEIRTGPTRLDS